MSNPLKSADPSNFAFVSTHALMLSLLYPKYASVTKLKAAALRYTKDRIEGDYIKRIHSRAE